MLEVKNLRDQTVDELKTLSNDLSREIFELRNELSMNRKLAKPHLLNEKKKDRARVLTILTEKEVKDGK